MTHEYEQNALWVPALSCAALSFKVSLGGQIESVLWDADNMPPVSEREAIQEREQALLFNSSHGLDLIKCHAAYERLQAAADSADAANHNGDDYTDEQNKVILAAFDMRVASCLAKANDLKELRLKSSCVTGFIAALIDEGETGYERAFMQSLDKDIARLTQSTIGGA